MAQIRTNQLSLDDKISYSSEVSISDRKDVIYKGYADDHYSGGGPGYWLQGGSYVYPSTATWTPQSFAGFEANYTTGYTTSKYVVGNMLTPWDLVTLQDSVLGQGTIANGYYNPTTYQYTFFYNSASNATASYLNVNSLGSVFDYAYYSDTIGSAVTVDASKFYHEPINPGYIYYALYKTDKDMVSAIHTIPGISTGTSSITSAGWLNLTASGQNYIDYAVDLDSNFVQTGCVRYNLIPNYSGTPANNIFFFSISKAASDVKNDIVLFHATTGNIVLAVYDLNGSTIIAPTALGAWVPVSGQPYEFLLDVDLNTGNTRLFIDGVQLGATQTATGTRDSNIQLLRIGNNCILSGGNVADFYMANFIVYNAPQKPLSFFYAPGYYLESTHGTKWYIPSLNRYQYLSRCGFNDLTFGETDYTSTQGLSQYQGGSINTLSRTSSGFGAMANIQVPLITLHGNYDAKTDRFNFLSDGTNAWGQVITSTSAGLVIYKYSAASISDKSVKPIDLFVSGNIQHTL